MASTRFGPQPALAVLRRQRWTVANAARAIDVKYWHLSIALTGRCRPHPDLTEKLSKLLDTPITELFTEEILEKPYWSERGRYERKQAVKS